MYQQLKDVSLYYEKSGQGTPILLLHGNGETHDIYDKLIPKLSRDYTVYAIDSRGHGSSSKVQSLDYGQMAEDIVQFITLQNITNPILYGFSDGGIIGLIMAVRYPELLSKLIISGANINPKGIKTKYMWLIRLLYIFTRDAKYQLMLTQPNISEAELKQIKSNTFILAGSKDVIVEKHTKYIASCIPSSTLQIIEGETHDSYVIHSERLYDILISYLRNN
ncbi:MAG: alpha/beta hydrolase [Herbinix sp.]|jgi:pimeloyl-ACP methyl ester carboxylesterase|nr:alpha/beta hydrolase [Herbinix sp.]